LWWFLIITVLGALFLLMRLYRYYVVKDLEEPQATFKQWYWLFFLAFATHWMLDSFTAFGTQIFQPFSDYRVAFNNIAVVDPLYTIPFLICVIIVSTLKRNTKKRALFNWLGIGISSLYMVLTIINKFHVDKVFDQALENRNIEEIRSRTSPTILNNLLWACVAEDKNQFYVGLYSIFDSDPNLHYLNVIPKNDSIRQAFSHAPEYKTLEWFSDGYLISFPTDSVTYLCDIRYGGMSDTIRDQRDLVFNFKVKEENGVLVFSENRESPQGKIGDIFRQLLKRMMGY
jgi:inner membrane protein